MPTLRRLFGEEPPPRVAEVRAKRTQRPMARVFAHDDLVYVLYFNADGTAADFQPHQALTTLVQPPGSTRPFAAHVVCRPGGRAIGQEVSCPRVSPPR